MKKIKELIVVEGKHDKDRLEKLFDCDIVLTNGLSLDKNSLEVIKTASKQQGVIVMTDPDSPGRRIRDEISKIAPNAKHVFVDKKDAIGKRNVGVEYVKDELLIEALEKVITFKENNDSLSWGEYLDLQLFKDKKKRDYLSTELHLGTANNKRIFKYLNLLDINKEEIDKILDLYDRNNRTN